ncbi:TDT family transporter [Cryptosporangium phraense]|uniref:C4-dicarboxylate ABC transporter n=1 Tax=Cryptosporangium phraense TaxID=2593070 RepID=A0A545AI09_9ACTN|nr:TDT family transporter [Cryptosporangium phraense]TQS40325.1 C4-dicarboxylate ABC transporter [Cryptosporangium phraense]
MTTLLAHPAASPAAAAPGHPAAAAPGHPAAAAPGHPAAGIPRGVTPNWFAAVMGTGIVAISAAGLPIQPPGLRTAAQLVWAAAAILLVALGVASAWQWKASAAHRADPVMMQFYGAPPMALMTVGGGTLLLGSDWIGLRAAVAIDLVLWTVGTIAGLATAVAIPYRMITRPEKSAAFGGWLMPVVPPMVSAANGALLIPHVPELRTLCLAMFGASLIAALLMIAHLWGHLLTQAPTPARLIPTLWIVLGPLGQSITAMNLLDPAAATKFGLPVWGFAMFWLVLVSALTLRERIPFGLPWWSFTFPVGTLVTGTTGLAARTGDPVLTAAAVGLFLLLATAWGTVSVLTGRYAWREHQPVAVDDLAAERHQ